MASGCLIAVDPADLATSCGDQDQELDLRGGPGQSGGLLERVLVVATALSCPGQRKHGQRQDPGDRRGDRAPKSLLGMGERCSAVTLLKQKEGVPAEDVVGPGMQITFQAVFAPGIEISARLAILVPDNRAGAEVEVCACGMLMKITGLGLLQASGEEPDTRRGVPGGGFGAPEVVPGVDADLCRGPVVRQAIQHLQRAAGPVPCPGEVAGEHSQLRKVAVGHR